jgi:hypothetical protein
MPVEFTERSFTYKIPDEWRGTTFTQGKTDTYTYKGPRFLTFEIDKVTGKESGWCLYRPEELERPCPLDCIRVTVDAHESDEMALLCEIANDCGHQEAVQFRVERPWVITHQAPVGYQSLWEPTEFEPRDIYDEFSITYDFLTGEFNLPIKDLELEGWRTDITWEDVRKVRNKMLEDTDGKISPDMPQSVQQQWLDYRELLRNLPTALAEFPAHIAAHMFPKTPGGVSEDRSDMTNKIMYTGGGISQG